MELPLYRQFTNKLTISNIDIPRISETCALNIDLNICYYITWQDKFWSFFYKNMFIMECLVCTFKHRYLDHKVTSNCKGQFAKLSSLLYVTAYILASLWITSAERKIWRISQLLALTHGFVNTFGQVNYDAYQQQVSKDLTAR